MTNNEISAVNGTATTTHRTDEMTIVRKVVALQDAAAKVPVWTGCNRTGWRPSRSEFFNGGAAAIMNEHGIDDFALWHWFCARADEVKR